MINNRQNFRLRKQIDISWAIPNQKIEGAAQVFNVSLTGALIVTDKLFKPEDGLVIYFHSREIYAFPAQGTLAWFKKVGPDAAQYQCGIRFSGQTPAWSRWLEEHMARLGDATDSNIIDHFIS